MRSLAVALRSLAAGLVLVGLGVPGCTCSDGPSGAASGAPGASGASASAGASGSLGASASAGASGAAIAPSGAASGARDSARGSDEIRPVYPLTVIAHPLATRLCGALHALPAKRKAECCSQSPGFTVMSECIRTLSSALNDKAVTLDEADVSRCVDALGKAYEGCDWVGPNAPRLPEACLGLIKGNVGEGGVCRSSLDCSKGMRCHGASPTTLGLCGPPRAAKNACDLSIDTLAAHTRQSNVDEVHPECAGYCQRHKCFDAVAVGGECKVTPECGPGRVCAAGKCSDAPLPSAGEPCPGAACAGEARCVKGRCVAPKPAGEACSADDECRGACVRSGNAPTGKCDKRCGP